MLRNWILLIALPCFAWAKQPTLTSLAPMGMAAQPSASERFTGAGKLSESAPKSSGRFSLQTELTEHSFTSVNQGKSESATSATPFRAEFSNGRFGLNARLTDTTAGALCGATPTDNIFANGFEN
jgi:hypothetical protein